MENVAPREEGGPIPGRVQARRRRSGPLVQVPRPLFFFPLGRKEIKSGKGGPPQCSLRVQVLAPGSQLPRAPAPRLVFFNTPGEKGC